MFCTTKTPLRDPRDERIEKLELALRIISTWARCDHLDGWTRVNVMKLIEGKASEALKK